MEAADAAPGRRSWNMKVLLAEDDRLIRHALAEVFQAEGFQVLEALDGDTALALFRRHTPDFVCLDIMMPRLDGYQVCRAIRQLNPRVPVVFITAKSEELDKVVGLDLGADDFIVKPFGAREVVARVRAIMRRCQLENNAETTSFLMDDLQVWPQQLRARRDDQTIDLSPRDLSILSLLYERRGQVVDRLTLFNRAWGLDYLPNSRTLDQHVSQLRKRIERDPSQPRIIRTVHGVGYRFDP
jgi:DNA-binding response OmpR family regulator